MRNTNDSQSHRIAESVANLTRRDQRAAARRTDRTNGTLAFPNKVTLADRIFRRS
jgi:hypothetical protein